MAADDNAETNIPLVETAERDVEGKQKQEKKTCNSLFQRYFPWFVCATSFCVQFFVLGFYKSFGPIYVKLLDSKENGGLGQGPTATSWVASLSICTSYLMTPISFEVIRRIKFRPAMLLGASLSGLGLLLSSYADSIYILYVTFGLLFGIGSSLCYSSSLLILPRYFTTHWSLAHGIALAGNGLGGMGLSPANGALMKSFGVVTGFRVMACVSFGVLFTCGMVYQTPSEKDEEDEEEETVEDDEVGADETEQLENAESEIIYYDTLCENKPLIIFLLSTYLLNFGYYVPYVHLVKLALDVGVGDSQADILPGFLSLSQSVGKVFIGLVFSYCNVNRIRAYQFSLIVLCLATTFVPVLKTYIGLCAYAVLFGFSDGCGQATNMIIIGDLAGKALLPKAYSTFLVCSASAFVVGPPIAGIVYSATGQYSIAFFMCGGMAFSSALLLFLVTCLRDEDQFRLRQKKKQEAIEEKSRTEEEKRLAHENASALEAKRESADKLRTRAEKHAARRKASLRKSQEFNKAMLTRSWHSIDFKPRTRSRESIHNARRERRQQRNLRDVQE